MRKFLYIVLYIVDIYIYIYIYHSCKAIKAEDKMTLTQFLVYLGITQTMISKVIIDLIRKKK